MKAVLKIILAVLLFILLFVFFISLPQFLSTSDEGVQFTPGRAWTVLTGFIADVKQGKFNQFLIGKMSYRLGDIFPDCFRNSFILTITAGFAGLVTGLAGGLFFSRYDFKPGVMVTAFFSFIPDFLIAIILQYIVLRIMRLFPGFPVKAAGYGEPVFVLPIIVICLTTGSYLAGSVYSRLRLEISQEYVLYARARGVSRGAIYGRHLLPAVVQHLRSDLRKYVSLILANLFILERIFNIRGLSRLIFSFAYVITGNFRTSAIVQAKIVPQLNVGFAGLAGVMVLFFLCYYILYGFLLLVQKGLNHE